MIEHVRATSAFIGNHPEISALRLVLADRDGDATPTAEREARRIARALVQDPAVAELRTSLQQTLFSIELSVSGPGAHQQHEISAGLNAVGVRVSPLTRGRWELSGFPLVTLPGGLTRLVRFLPGRAAIIDPPDIEIPSEQLLDLASPDVDTRRRSWVTISAALDDVESHVADDSDIRDADPSSSPDSWQIVQARSSWTDPDGGSAGDVAVHLRRGDTYFLVLEGEGGFSLRPVPSIHAWESMIQVLPDHRDIARP